MKLTTNPSPRFFQDLGSATVLTVQRDEADPSVSTSDA